MNKKKQIKILTDEILRLNPFVKSVNILLDEGRIEYELHQQLTGHFIDIDDLIKTELEKLSEENIIKKRQFWEKLKTIT